MAYKLDVRKIIRAHLNTLVNDDDQRADWRDWTAFLVAPAIITILLCYFGLEIEGEYVDAIVGGLSVYVGLALNMIVLVFQMSNKEESSDFRKEFARDLIANITFSVLLCIISIICTTLSQFDLPKQMLWGKGVLNALAIFFIIEIFLSVVLLANNMYYELLAEVNNKNKS